MKKIISVFLIVLLMLSLTVSVYAEETAFNMKITSSSDKVRPGDQFDVTFILTSITEKSGLIGLDMVIEYDESKLTVVNKTNIFPEQWGKDAADFSPALSKNTAGKLEQRLLYDGDDWENASIPLFKDNELGVKVTFKALENASGNAKIGLSSELLGTSNNLDTVYGKSSPIMVSIILDASGTTKSGLPTTTNKPVDPVTTAPTTKTSDKTQDTAMTGETDPESTESGEITESAGNTETVTTVITNTTENESSETSGGATSAAPSTPATSKTPVSTAGSDNGGSSTMLIIVIIAAVVLAAVAAFAILKFKKSQNDDNPVNPG